MAVSLLKTLLPNRLFLFLSAFSILILFVIFFTLPVTAVPLVDDAPAAYTIEVFAGNGDKGLRDGRKAKAQFNWPTGIAISSDGLIFVADYGNNAIRSVSRSGRVRTMSSAASGAVKGGYKDGPLKDALFQGPDNIAIDNHGNIFVADADNFRIRKITPDGVVSTVAGGEPGYRNGPALKARFGYPTGIAVASDGTLYVADRRTHTVRKITTDGIVSTIAGNSNPGYADGQGVMSHLKEPIGVAVYGGVVYVADSGNHAVRKIMADGRVLTLAGRPEAGFRNGSGGNARFYWPTGITTDSKGNVYLCDSKNNSIRRITPDGRVSTIGLSAMSGDKRPFLNKINLKKTRTLNFPTGIAVDASGSIYVADSGNNNIKKITKGR